MLGAIITMVTETVERKFKPQDVADAVGCTARCVTKHLKRSDPDHEGWWRLTAKERDAWIEKLREKLKKSG